MCDVQTVHVNNVDRPVICSHFLSEKVEKVSNCNGYLHYASGVGFNRHVFVVLLDL